MTKQTLILEVNGTRLATVEESQMSLLATLNISVQNWTLTVIFLFQLTYTHFAIQNCEMITRYLNQLKCMSLYIAVPKWF